MKKLKLFRVLPYELGRLFQLQTLGLNGNPLPSEIIELYSAPNGTYELIGYLLDNQPPNMEQPGWFFTFRFQINSGPFRGNPPPKPFRRAGFPALLFSIDSILKISYSLQEMMLMRNSNLEGFFKEFSIIPYDS